ncbi:malto-oligosyltrehalose synthase [Spirosoma sp. HMF4905]|uniref:Malto-oligosyltrehalose synthase n=1 Tax=Spirosoma arboris TaxID=2682092 RepID=A0A7K1S4D8_9BACT|nr:malto-oligosyltrehalose synthase [Spirosoma arboris]MVM28693.1 malto-oligosyltrehalose synthase [Spirosoma arboris]
MNNPISTYRIQFHKNFTFLDFEHLIPYLDKLGIKTVYASPIFEAVPGSIHGYDTVNLHRINPEIGTEEQLQTISRQLTKRGINWLQDIVPNHMAFHPDNAWLMDVLEKGQRSLYAPFFDIDWTSPVYQGRLMVPFLGDSLPEVIAQGELTVAYQNKRFVLVNQESAYPLHLRSYATVLQTDKAKMPESIQALIRQLDELETTADAKNYTTCCTELQDKLAHLLQNLATDTYLKSCLKAVNASPTLRQQIADQQAYRLCYYSETDYQINYRRFFTVNNLICLNSQDPVVFEQVHRYTKKLLEAGVFQGLRVDHVDGLYNPTDYLDRLRELAGPAAYIIVEKILEQGEELPPYWPIQGATGYQYLSLLNNLLTQTRSQKVFTRFYHELLGEKTTVHGELRDKKAIILYEHMGGELDNLHQLLLDLNLIEAGRLETVQPETLKTAIGEFLIQCPVYRFYGNHVPLNEREAEAIQEILDQIQISNPELTEALDLLEDVLLTSPLAGSQNDNDRALRFYQRCMQFTGPLMAKGVEDTLMYTYNRFIGHDEVGDSPEYFGLTTDEFHQKMMDREANWPLALNATSTHDTKRGEDVRSRLNVLTDLADEWVEEVRIWQQLNQTNEAPDRNDEYFIYQTLIGAYPMPGMDSPDQEDADFADRLTAYLQKALREAKRYSSHTKPNEVYEETTKAFAINLLDQKRPFWKRFATFHQRIADFGIINSLAQVVLKCTCPGLPDVYQGSEFWDLSLVDPDNRRPVDYKQRQQRLGELVASGSDDLWPELWQNRYDARIKLWLLHILLTERNRHSELFANGRYIPLLAEGAYKQHVLAFARQHEQMWYVVAVPLDLASVCSDQQTDIVSLDWKDTRLILPDDAPVRWNHRLIKARGEGAKDIAVRALFPVLPLAVVKLEKA